MPDIIDVTPVSSHTSGESEPVHPPQPEGRVATGIATLKRRLLVMAIVLGVIAAVVVVMSVGLLLFFALAAAAAALSVWMYVRSVFGRRPPARR